MSLTEKDRIEQFKRDLRSYTYHQKMVAEIDYKIEELKVKLQGVSSPDMKPVVLENAGDPYRENKIALMMEEGELMNERNKHLLEMQKIDEALRLLPAEEQDVLIQVYIMRKRYDSVAVDSNKSRATLFRDINQSILNILKNAT